MKTSPAFSTILLLLLALTTAVCSPSVRTGADNLLSDRLELLRNKRVGVICNHTSVLSNGIHLVDTLLSAGIRVTALFGPEHGIRGLSGAGEHVSGSVDSATGIPVYSLYGKSRKPTGDMLSDVDVVLFDVQDIGARFYTYVSTMALAMEACAEEGKEFIVLDRPNPINGTAIEGPPLDSAHASFVGMFPIPIRHAATIGELALMIKGEGWIDSSRSLRLSVIPISGWNRTMWFDETGLPWIPPSPNMKSLRTATVYPGTCLIEGTNVSEGRGTEKPFEYIGAPFIDGKELAASLNKRSLPGVAFQPFTFTPVAQAAASNPKYNGVACEGIYVEVTGRSEFTPVATGLAIIEELSRLYPNEFSIHRSTYLRLLGSDLPASSDTSYKNLLTRYRLYR